MKNSVKKVLCLLLACSMLLCCFACNKSEKVVAGKKPVYDNDKVIYVSATCRPLATEQRIKDFMDCGFNLYTLTEDNGALGTESYNEQIRICEKYGLDFFVRSYDNFYIEGLYEYSGTDNVYIKRLGDEIYNSEKMKGFYLWDEPSYGKFDEIANKFVDWYNKDYQGKYYWLTNLYPSYAYSNQSLGIDADENNTAYERYVNGFVDKVISKLKGDKVILGLDHYPLRTMSGKNITSSTWLLDLAVVANATKNVGCIMQCFIQSYGSNGMRHLKSKADVGYQVYSSMAFGAKSLEFYIYTDYGTSEIGLVKGSGEKREQYYYVQEALKDVHAMEKAYLSFDWQGFKPVIGTLNTKGVNDCFKNLAKYESDNIPGVDSVKTRDDALIGFFKDKEDRNGYMIANFSDPVDGVTNVVELALNGKYSRALCYVGGEEKDLEVIDGKLKVVLEKGEGAFVIPY